MTSHINKWRQGREGQICVASAVIRVSHRSVVVKKELRESEALDLPVYVPALFVLRPKDDPPPQGGIVEIRGGAPTSG